MSLKNPIIAMVLALTCAYTSIAQNNPAQKYVEQLKSTEELREAVWGIQAVRLDGSVVAEYNPRTRMLPASTTKLITTGIALNELGSDYRFKTRIAHSGTVEDGVLKGDLYIVGGADPTIGARDSVAIELQKTFSGWADFVKKAGITRIEGRVIGDGRYIDGEFQHLAWQLEDGFGGDGTGMSGLSFYRNLQDVRVTAGKSVGAPVKVEAIYPETPWVSWANVCVTAPKGEGNDLYFASTNLAPVASMSGTYAIDLAPRRITCANGFGAMTCAYYFYKYLEGIGILAEAGPADIDMQGNVRDFDPDGSEPEKALALRSLTMIGESQSPLLKEIVRQTNHVSDNFYAETLLRVLAKEKTGSARYDSCTVAESAALKKLGVKLADHVQVLDGSGLGRKNYISPEFFVEFLKSMRSSKAFDDYLKSLPQPGKYGTMSTRMSTASPEVKKRVYMKSGSMNGVRCFSGYILPSSGKEEDTIVFSVMTNNTIVSSSRMNFIMDKIIGLLAAEN